MTTPPPARRGPFLIGIAVLLVAGLIWFGSRVGRDGGEDSSGSAPGQPTASEVTVSSATGPATVSLRREPREPRRAGQTQEAADEEALAYLRELFGATIDSSRTQIKAIEKLIGYLQEANREDLGNMDRLDRREALRDARQRYFGEEAAEIWAETLRQESIRDVMDTIDQTQGTTVEEKFGDFLEAIVDSYGEAADGFIERRQTELLQSFLGIPAVQQDLRALSPEERAPRLDEIRRGMGMDDPALERWRDLDAQRDQAWAQGEKYMTERARIVDGFDSEEQDRRLADLRERYFPNEADIVQAEEDGGFFRYGHDRMIGNE